MKQLVDFAEHLRDCSSGTQFDYTSASVISTWFHDTLAANPILLASSVSMHAESLSNEVALTSGHGMQEIWRNLVLPELEESVHTTVTRLDRLAAGLNPRLASYGMALGVLSSICQLI
jgi:hypothetical protein